LNIPIQNPQTARDFYGPQITAQIQMRYSEIALSSELERDQSNLLNDLHFIILALFQLKATRQQTSTHSAIQYVH